MAYCPLSGLPVFDQGYPVDGALLYAYDVGTSTPRSLYLTAAIDPDHVHPTPVQMADGVFPVMFAGPGSYDVAIYGSDGAQIRRINGLAGDPSVGSPVTAFDPLAQVSTGDIILAHRTGPRAGYVPAMGGTIGNGATTATVRSNDDCHALFVFLYNNEGTLPVSGGRSAGGAEADWNANKTITVPDETGRFNIPAGAVLTPYMKL